MAERVMSMRALLRRTAAGLLPGYFALVMATGIIASDLYRVGQGIASVTFLLLAGAAYGVLLLLTVMRIATARDRLVADINNPAIGFSSLTIVAASGVLAAHPVFDGHDGVRIMLGCIALVAWLVLVPMTVRMALRIEPRALREVARGNWLLLVVSTQALAIITLLLHEGVMASDTVLRVAAALWIVGMGIYICLIGPVTHRFVSLMRSDPAKITGDFWITMGALAITARATGQLIHDLAQIEGQFEQLEQLARAVGYIVWFACVAWIPVLIFSEWRQLRARGLPSYDPNRWSTIFPMGMFAAGSISLGGVLDEPVMRTTGDVWTLVAVVAWAFTAYGLARVLRRALRRDRRECQHHEAPASEAGAAR